MKQALPSRFAHWLLAIALAAAAACSVSSLQAAPLSLHRAGRIPIKEFSRMIQNFSEYGGDFPTDNLASNERNYLQVTGKLKELGVSGGAYLGVGPEQNFSYIAKIRPRIAFIVDIRRQAVVQHLLYKALFHLAENRAQFLSLLFSKPFPKTHFDKAGSFDQLLDYIAEAPTTQEAFQVNLNRIRKTIEVDFQFLLTPEDIGGLAHIYNFFWQDNLSVGFRFGHGEKVPGPWGFPDLRELLLATDLDGKRGNFLATEEGYQFVRKLQEQNRVIPIRGDFAGTKALASVASYLRKNDYTVSAFYTSNVEEYLYENKVFGRFEENVRQLPVSGRSVFIRAVRSGWAPHSFWAQGDHITPFLQKIPVFLDDYKAGKLPDYWSLVTTHTIPAAESLRQFLPSPAP